MALQLAHHFQDEEQVATEEKFKDENEDVTMRPPTETENIDVVLFVTIGVLQTCEFCKGALAVCWRRDLKPCEYNVPIGKIVGLLFEGEAGDYHDGFFGTVDA